MKYLAVYSHERGFGSVDCNIAGTAPTLNQIRAMEDEINQLHFAGRTKVVILNLILLSDEAEEATHDRS